MHFVIGGGFPTTTHSVQHFFILLSTALLLVATFARGAPAIAVSQNDTAPVGVVQSDGGGINNKDSAILQALGGVKSLAAPSSPTLANKVASRDCGGKATHSIRPRVDPNELVPLKLYTDSENGCRRDHYGIVRPSANESSYVYEKTVGKVLNARSASDCGCATARVAVSLARLHSNDTTKHPVYADYKLVGAEIGEKVGTRWFSAINFPYEPTGEDYYCVLKKGACGATIPLHVFDHADERGIMANLNTLCYIWPRDFKPVAKPAVKQ